MAIPQDLIIEHLRALALPDGMGLTAADAFVETIEANGTLRVKLEVGYPIDSVGPALAEQIRVKLQALSASVEVDLAWRAPSVQAVAKANPVPGVRNIIAVSSGKGGVGKSTTAANLALALLAEGATVGVLDADIYGPSQQQMLGVADKRPESHSATMMKPIRTAHGLQMVSMGNLITKDTPVVWRGPMVSGALQQLLRNAHWEDIDYLIIDMPPGTGDIQLTLAQTVPVSGAVIVTTPQDIALLDAVKGVEMFRKVHIPVLGVVENMSTHICSQCGHAEPIFGENGGARLAQDYGVELLGQLPLRLDIRQQTDAGMPPVAADPESAVSHIYRTIARKLAAALWRESFAGEAMPDIQMTDD